MSNRALPPLNWLRAFEAAARHLSFTSAAGELNMTQSAVSQQIKSLESYLGQPLFRRLARALELTPTGQNYLPFVRDAFSTLSQGTRMLTDDNADRVISVQTNITFSNEWLAPRLPRLYARNPDIHLNITTAIWDPIERAADADIEIRYLQRPAVDRKTQRLTWDTFYPVCAPDYQVDLAEVHQHRLFYCTAMMTTWEVWAKAAGIAPKPSPMITHMQVLSTALRAAEAGAGLAMAHDTTVADAISQGRLMRPFEARAEMPEAFYLTVNPKAEEKPDAQDFAAWIREEMGVSRSQLLET